MERKSRLRASLFPGEQDFFQTNKHVAGMAAEDGNVILNPFSGNSAAEQDAVYTNELSRLLMREQDVRPAFDLTPEQRSQFEGTPYATNEPAMKETIAARIVSGDPSAKQPTGDQAAFAKALAKMLETFK